MIGSEPIATARRSSPRSVSLLAASVALSRASARLGLPVALLFLLVGVLAGIGGHRSASPSTTTTSPSALGTTALVLILFDGGLNTPLASARDGARARDACSPRVGVLATAGLVAVAAHLVGLSLADGAAARRHRVVHRCGRGVLRAHGERHAAAASASGSRSRWSRGSTIPWPSSSRRRSRRAMVRGVALQPLRVALDVVLELVVGAIDRRTPCAYAGGG